MISPVQIKQLLWRMNFKQRMSRKEKYPDSESQTTLLNPKESFS